MYYKNYRIISSYKERKYIEELMLRVQGVFNN